MSGWKARAATVAIAAGFISGVLYLFGVQFASGDVYPEYSSLRSDPAGARLLFDALARVPGVTVARNYLPLESFEQTGAAIFLLGIDPNTFPKDSEMQMRIERIAGKGNRVILAMANLPDKSKAPPIGSLYRNWEVKLGAESRKGGARRVFFSTARDWKVLDHVGGRLLAIERAFGKGSVVMAAASDDFANQATLASDRLDIVDAALGPCRRVVFDEQHFGIAETGSVVALARRFRLTGMALGLALCAMLFMWRNASGFPPPHPANATERLSGRTSHQGLLTLLRRHVQPGDLAAACWREWLSANRRSVAPERIRQAEAIIESGGKKPVEALLQAREILDPLPHSKGAL